jgi:hypothetical protein
MGETKYESLIQQANRAIDSKDYATANKLLMQAHGDGRLIRDIRPPRPIGDRSNAFCGMTILWGLHMTLVTVSHARDG